MSNRGPTNKDNIIKGVRNMLVTNVVSDDDPVVMVVSKDGAPEGDFMRVTRGVKSITVNIHLGASKRTLRYGIPLTPGNSKTLFKVVLPSVIDKLTTCIPGD